MCSREHSFCPRQQWHPTSLASGLHDSRMWYILRNRRFILLFPSMDLVNIGKNSKIALLSLFLKFSAFSRGWEQLLYMYNCIGLILIIMIQVSRSQEYVYTLHLCNEMCKVLVLTFCWIHWGWSKQAHEDWGPGGMGVLKEWERWESGSSGVLGWTYKASLSDIQALLQRLGSQFTWPNQNVGIWGKLIWAV